MRWPKLRELKEAVTVVFSPRFTTRFPSEPHVAPEGYRGKAEFDTDACVGCGACVNVCPTEALSQVDDVEADVPTRKITYRYDACIFCGNCSDKCTTEKGINLTNEWDLASLDRAEMAKTHEYDLQLCEKCGAVIGTKKHLVWLAEKLGPYSYTNPSLLLSKRRETLSEQTVKPENIPESASAADFMRILCQQCKCELNIRL